MKMEMIFWLVSTQLVKMYRVTNQCDGGVLVAQNNILRFKQNLKMTFSNAFSTIYIGLSPVRRQATTLTNGDAVHWHTYAPPGCNELAWLIYNSSRCSMNTVGNFCVVLSKLGKNKQINTSRKQSKHTKFPVNCLLLFAYGIELDFY